MSNIRRFAEFKKTGNSDRIAKDDVIKAKDKIMECWSKVRDDQRVLVRLGFKNAEGTSHSFSGILVSNDDGVIKLQNDVDEEVAYFPEGGLKYHEVSVHVKTSRLAPPRRRTVLLPAP